MHAIIFASMGALRLVLRFEMASSPSYFKELYWISQDLSSYNYYGLRISGQGWDGHGIWCHNKTTSLVVIRLLIFHLYVLSAHN